MINISSKGMWVGPGVRNCGFVSCPTKIIISFKALFISLTILVSLGHINVEMCMQLDDCMFSGFYHGWMALCCGTQTSAAAFH